MILRWKKTNTKKQKKREKNDDFETKKRTKKDEKNDDFETKKKKTKKHKKITKKY